jgi:hypothetical protein
MTAVGNAFAAIEATLPQDQTLMRAPGGKAAISSPCRMWSIGSIICVSQAQSFSDVILRLATAD